MQGAPEERAATRTRMYASKRSEEQRRRWISYAVYFFHA